MLVNVHFVCKTTAHSFATYKMSQRKSQAPFLFKPMVVHNYNNQHVTGRQTLCRACAAEIHIVLFTMLGNLSSTLKTSCKICFIMAKDRKVSAHTCTDCHAWAWVVPAGNCLLWTCMQCLRACLVPHKMSANSNKCEPHACTWGCTCASTQLRVQGRSKVRGHHDKILHTRKMVKWKTWAQPIPVWQVCGRSRISGRWTYGVCFDDGFDVTQFDTGALAKTRIITRNLQHFRKSSKGQQTRQYLTLLAAHGNARTRKSKGAFCWRGWVETACACGACACGACACRLCVCVWMGGGGGCCGNIRVSLFSASFAINVNST